MSTDTEKYAHCCTKHIGDYYKCVYIRKTDGKHWMNTSKYPRGQIISAEEWVQLMKDWRRTGGVFEKNSVLNRGIEK